MNRNKHLPWIGLFPLMLLGWLLIVLDKVSIPFLAVLGLSILTLWLCSLLGRGITEETQWILLILAAGFLLKLLHGFQSQYFSVQQKILPDNICYQML